MAYVPLRGLVPRFHLILARFAQERLGKVQVKAFLRQLQIAQEALSFV